MKQLRKSTKTRSKEERKYQVKLKNERNREKREYERKRRKERHGKHRSSGLVAEKLIPVRTILPSTAKSKTKFPRAGVPLAPSPTLGHKPLPSKPVSSVSMSIRRSLLPLLSVLKMVSEVDAP